MGFWETMGRACVEVINEESDRLYEARAREARAERLLREAQELRADSVFGRVERLRDRRLEEKRLELEEERLRIERLRLRLGRRY